MKTLSTKNIKGREARRFTTTQKVVLWSSLSLVLVSITAWVLYKKKKSN
jgi:hypothetical protein